MKGITVKELFAPNDSLGYALLKGVTYPFEALCRISDYIKEIGPTLDPEIYESKGENIWIAKSAKVAPTASITGPCIIGERTEVRHCAFIRGSTLVGNDCIRTWAQGR